MSSSVDASEKIAIWSVHSPFREVRASGGPVAGEGEPGERLDGLAEAHFVGEDGAPVRSEVQRALDLVWVERCLEERPLAVARSHARGECADGGRERFALSHFACERRDIRRNAHDPWDFAVQPFARCKERFDGEGRVDLHAALRREMARDAFRSTVGHRVAANERHADWIARDEHLPER